MHKERPILFSAPMVRAILDGRKTQTRRILKGSTENKGPYNPAYLEAHRKSRGWEQICPYGKPGYRLWVRETWAFRHGRFWLKAHMTEATVNGAPADWKWKPSIHMPRAASRILLEITSVRIERLQDISESDAKAEGVEYHISDFGAGYGNYEGDCLKDGTCGTLFSKAVHSFTSLWRSINGPKSWNENPWVWVIEFKRIKP